VTSSKETNNRLLPTNYHCL